MGLDYYIGENQVRITNYHHYNEFLNLVGQLGDFPQILDHSSAAGGYALGFRKAGLYTGSIEALKAELDMLLGMPLPEYAKDIAGAMLEGVELALKNKMNITLDDGAMFGS